MKKKGDHFAPPSVGVVVPVLNERDFVAGCLESLRTARSRYRGIVEVCFADNGSSDGTYEFVQSCAGEWIKLLRDEGATVARLRNEGARRVKGEVLIFLDADCVAPEKHFQNVVAVLEREECAATGYSVQPIPNAHWVERHWHALHRHREPERLRHINSGNFAVTRAAFEAVDGFDPELVSGEDADICARLADAGFTVRPDDRLVVEHRGGPRGIAAFYRQQLWHAAGPMDPTARIVSDYPTAGAVSYAVCLLLSILVLGLAPGGVLLRLAAALATSSLVPVAAVAFRIREGGIGRVAVSGVLLYHLYFSARAWSLARKLWERL